MYNIVIVDDDRIVRQGIARSIPWEEHGFRIAGEAADGEQGLQVISSVHPHIVISDIKMPFMDGLEMAGELRKRFPSVKLILLTGYEDFHYAREAVKVKAFDYLLKPVDKESLLEKAQQAAKEWEREASISQKVREGTPFLRQRWLRKLLSNRYGMEALTAEMEELGIRFTGTCCGVALLKLDDYRRFSETAQEAAEQEALKYAVQNISEELLVADPLGTIFDYEDDELLLVYSTECERAQADPHVRQLAERIRQSVKEYAGTTVSIALGKPHKGLGGIGQSLREAQAVMAYRHLVGTDAVFGEEDIHIREAQIAPDLGERIGEVAAKVGLGLTTDALERLDELERLLSLHVPLTLDQVRLLAIQTVLLLCKSVEEGDREWRMGNWHELTAYYDEIHRKQTVRGIFDVLKKVAVELARFVNLYRQTQTKSVVEAAAAYIAAHFSKDGLSLREVAKAVHVSPTYLSILFKQEKNINFSDFLLEIRMKKAMELLRHSGMKTYQVAEAVGYSNPQYFSVCFKKCTGFSPLEFKRKK